MQVCASHPDAWSDRTPHRIDVDLGEEPPAVVQNPLISHTDRSRRHRIATAQRLERTHTVGREVDAGSRRRPGRYAFDDLCTDPARTQGAAKRESRDSCAHDQHGRWLGQGANRQKRCRHRRGQSTPAEWDPRVGSTSGRMFVLNFARECSVMKSAAGLRTGIPTQLSLPSLSFAEIACFSRKNNENEERANG